jgi:2-polyprenyl-6-methoxyphenol hydroxylase-like FAD-dependent oxidoreductase
LQSDYTTTSPCSPIDLPQALLEPILLKFATSNGFKARLDTEFISFTEVDDLIISTFKDTISNQTYKIQSRYLFGADGANSRVMKQLDLPLNREQGQGKAINVHVKADLSHLAECRMGNLHWIIQPDVDHPDFAWIGLVRMVKPWNEWMFILFPSLGSAASFQPSNEQYLRRVRDFIGDDTIPAEILSVSEWYVKEAAAGQYSRGNMLVCNLSLFLNLKESDMCLISHCLGGAVHRHPPFDGLGTNSCIQDAFNLAWKVAFVIKGGDITSTNCAIFHY